MQEIASSSYGLLAMTLIPNDFEIAASGYALLAMTL